MKEHEPVMKCTTLGGTPGFLCSCGRTILGETQCYYHFGKKMEQLESEMRPHILQPVD